MTSLDYEREFYAFYFGDLKDNINLFYDPLKKRLKNPYFKSISRDYLGQLKKSAKYCKDLRDYCVNHMVFDCLEKYPDKILARFKENRAFLEDLNKSKSKFEWVKFELVAAIFHFLFVFDTSQSKIINLGK